MGRYEHEAAAVDPKSGAVYLTEDRHRSLFYRYLPDVPQKLAAGGRLQALAVFESPAYDTRNWSSEQWMRPMEWHQCEWIDLDDVDTDVDDLRFRGFERGAARFARGEGLCYSNGSVFMTCTIGGPARLGQVFEYRLGENNDAPGALRLVAESGPRSLLRHCDNIAMSPWGDLIICEDTTDHCGLVGMTPGGRQYALADNAYTPSELAGLCFSPDGTTMFVNIQHRGLTLAITGPWPLVSDLAA
jgi:secreted PhoX family phosphatase